MNKKSLLFTTLVSGALLAFLLFLFPGILADRSATDASGEKDPAVSEPAEQVSTPDFLDSAFSRLPGPVSDESEASSHSQRTADTQPAGLGLIDYENILFEEVGEPGPDGRFKRVRVVETDFHYPHLRIVETLERDAATGDEVVRGWQAMVADHVVAKMDTSLSDSEIETMFADVGMSVRRRMEPQSLFLLQFPLNDVDAVEAALARLNETGEVVEYAEPDYIVTPAAIEEPNDPSFDFQWGLHNTSQFGGVEGADIDALRGWEVTADASDVVVAVLDTGVNYNHEDLKRNMWRNPREQEDGLDNSGNGYEDDIHGVNVMTGGSPMDFNGHGTHVAGTIGAAGNNHVGVTGVAWDVQLMAVKFLDPFGTLSGAILSVDYARENGAEVINASYGGFYYSRAEKEAIRRARDAGIVFVAAAGNDQKNIDTFDHFFPAGYDLDNIVRVGASDPNNRLASFSNYGPEKVDVIAPGASIFSTYVWEFDPDLGEEVFSDSAYTFMSGTSMAAPHVSGIMALIAAEYGSEDYRTQINRFLAGTREESYFFEGLIRDSRLANLYGPLSQGDEPILFTPLQDLEFTDGDTRTLEVDAAGRPAVEYTWYRNDDLIPGEEEATLTLVGMTAEEAGIYRVEISNEAGTVESSARLRYNPGNDALAHAVGAPDLVWTTSEDRPWETVGGEEARSYPALGNDESSKLITTINGPATVSFEWKVSSERHYDKLRFRVNGEEKHAISGETGWESITFDLSETGSHQVAWSYEKDLVGSDGEDAGWVRNVSVEHRFPHIIEQPRSIEVLEGDTARLSVTASGDPSPQYRWYRNGERLEGRTTRRLELREIAEEDAGVYEVAVWNSYGTLRSVPVQVTVVAEPNAPFITAEPEDTDAVEGDTVVLRVGYGGTAPLEVQWNKNGAPIEGASGDRLTLESVDEDDSGLYSATVSNAAGTVTSGQAAVTVVGHEATFDGFLQASGGGEAVGSASDTAASLYHYATGSRRAPEAVVTSEELIGTASAAEGDLVDTRIDGEKHFGLKFERSRQAVGVSFILDASDDLENWEAVPAVTRVLKQIDEDTELVLLREKAPAPEGSVRYLRLRIRHEGL